MGDVLEIVAIRPEKMSYDIKVKDHDLDEGAFRGCTEWQLERFFSDVVCERHFR